METRPERVTGLDLLGFRFDPLSESILGYVDRGFSVKQMADNLDAGIVEIVKTLNVLKDGGVLTWDTSHLSRPRHTIPAPAPPKQQIPEDPVALMQGDLDSICPAPPDEKDRDVERGVIGKKTAQSLVANATKSSFTGSISIENNGDTIIFFLEQGQPKGVKATAQRHDHGTMLNKMDLLDDDRLARYRASRAAGVEPVFALKDVGFKERATMTKIVKWRARELYREVQAWVDGTYRITPFDTIPSGVMRCDLELGSVRKTDWRKTSLTEEQKQFISDKKLHHIVVSSSAKEIIAGLNLNTKEKRYAGHVIDGAPMTLRRAITISPLFKAITGQLLYILVEKGAFGLSETNPATETPIPLDELKTHCERLEADNHFGALGVHAVSIEKEIKIRYEKRLEKLDLEHYKNANAEQLEHLERIRSRLDLAWRVLSDEKSRREYRKSVYSKYQLHNFFTLQVDKALSALTMKINPAEALALAQSAWDLIPGHPSAQKIIITSLEAMERHSEISKYKGPLHSVQPNLG